MDSFILNMNICTISAQNLWKNLNKHPNLSKFVIPDKMPDNFCFRIGLPLGAVARTKYDIDKVSISVPPDARCNRVDIDSVSADNLPNMFEIALVGTDDELSYKHPLCCDVLRFDSVESLTEKLVEIANYPTESKRNTSQCIGCVTF